MKYCIAYRNEKKEYFTIMVKESILKLYNESDSWSAAIAFITENFGVNCKIISIGSVGRY